MKHKKSKCRVCLRLRTNLLDLSDSDNTIPKLKIRLQTAFYNLTGIFVTEIEPARLMCLQCVSRLREAAEFQLEAKTSHDDITQHIAAGTWEPKEDEGPDFDETCVKVEADLEYARPLSPLEEAYESSIKVEDVEIPKTDESDDRAVLKRSLDEVEFDQDEILRLGLKRYRKQGSRGSRVYTCDSCSYETNVEWKVMQHIKTTHMSDIKAKRKPSGSKVDSRWVKRQLKLGRCFVCDYCKEEFSQYKDLHTHMRKSHVVTRPFKCSWDNCSKSFCSQLQLDKHINYRHNSKSMCEVCGINILKSSMKDHLRTHRPDRPFPCPHEGCSTAFKDKNGLTQHLACVHNTERKFACHMCGKSYKLSTTLLAHIRVTHTFENCEQCLHCSRWYLNSNQLQIHINQVHLNLRPFPCELCGSSHKSQAKLYRHLRQMHPDMYQMWLEAGKLKCRKKIEASSTVVVPPLDQKNPDLKPDVGFYASKFSEYTVEHGEPK